MTKILPLGVRGWTSIIIIITATISSVVTFSFSKGLDQAALISHGTSITKNSTAIKAENANRKREISGERDERRRIDERLLDNINKNREEFLGFERRQAGNHAEVISQLKVIGTKIEMHSHR